MSTSNIIIITTVSSNFTYIYIITLSHTFVKNYFKNRIEVIMQFGLERKFFVHYLRATVIEILKFII